MKNMTTKYSAKHAVTQKEYLEGKARGNCTHTFEMRKKIINKNNLLRRIGCHSAVLSPGVTVECDEG